MRGLATSAAEKDSKLPVCIWSTLLQNQEKTFSMKTDSSLPGANLWGENPETFCQLGTKEAQLKRKSPPAQYLRISIGCRKGSRCGQNFHKKSGSTGRILNKYIYQFKQTLGSSRPSAAGPKCTPDLNKTLSSLQKFSWVTWVSHRNIPLKLPFRCSDYVFQYILAESYLSSILINYHYYHYYTSTFHRHRE